MLRLVMKLTLMGTLLMAPIAPLVITHAFAHGGGGGAAEGAAVVGRRRSRWWRVRWCQLETGAAGAGGLERELVALLAADTV